MSFKDALDSIAKGVEDLSQLNVRTYTGEINGSAQGSAQALLDKALLDGNLEVVAITTIKLDGDVDQFMSSSDKATSTIMAAHSNAVEAGQRSRKAMLDMFTDAVKKAINKLD